MDILYQMYMYCVKAILDKAAAMKACGSKTKECELTDADLPVVRARGANGMVPDTLEVIAALAPCASSSIRMVQEPTC